MLTGCYWQDIVMCYVDWLLLAGYCYVLCWLAAAGRILLSVMLTGCCWQDIVKCYGDWLLLAGYSYVLCWLAAACRILLCVMLTGCCWQDIVMCYVDWLLLAGYCSVGKWSFSYKYYLYLKFCNKWYTLLVRYGVFHWSGNKGWRTVQVTKLDCLYWEQLTTYKQTNLFRT